MINMKRFLISIIVLCLLFSCTGGSKSVEDNDVSAAETNNDGITFKLILNMPETMVDEQIKIVGAEGNDATPLRSYQAKGNHLDVDVKFKEANIYQLQIGNRYPILFVVSGEEDVIEINGVKYSPVVSDEEEEADADEMKYEEEEVDEDELDLEAILRELEDEADEGEE